MPTTSKMGIVYPSSSDLVKDGATNMGTIATTVDSKTGLVLINTTNFSAVSSQILSNIFTSSFEDYLITLTYTTSGTAGINLRLRTGSTSAATNYNWQYVQGNNTSASAGRVTATTSLEIAGASNGSFFSQSFINLYAPQLTRATTYISNNNNNYGAYNVPIISFYGGSHSDSTSYESAELLISSGTFTGTVKIYGYNK